MTHRWLTASRSKDADRNQINTAPPTITLPSPTSTLGLAASNHSGPPFNVSHSIVQDDRLVDTAGHVHAPISLSDGSTWQGHIQSSRVFDVFSSLSLFEILISREIGIRLNYNKRTVVLRTVLVMKSFSFLVPHALGS